MDEFLFIYQCTFQSPNCLWPMTTNRTISNTSAANSWIYHFQVFWYWHNLFIHLFNLPDICIDSFFFFCWIMILDKNGIYFTVKNDRFSVHPPRISVPLSEGNWKTIFEKWKICMKTLNEMLMLKNAEQINKIVF